MPFYFFFFFFFFFFFSWRYPAVDLQHSTPLVQCVWRAESCLVVMLPWAGWSYYTQGWRGAKDVKIFGVMVATSFCWSFWFVSFFWGLDNTSIAHAYVLSNVHSVLIVCFNLLTGREKVPRMHLLGVALAMAGAGVCVWDSGRSGGGGAWMPSSAAAGGGGGGGAAGTVAPPSRQGRSVKSTATAVSRPRLFSSLANQCLIVCINSTSSDFHIVNQGHQFAPKLSYNSSSRIEASSHYQ